MDVDWAALGLLPPFEEHRVLPPAAFDEHFGSDDLGYDFTRLADPTSWELSSRYHWPPLSPWDSSPSEAGSSSASSYGGNGDFPVPNMPEGARCDGIDPLLLCGGSSPASEPLFDSPVPHRSGHRLSFGSSVGEEYNDDLRDGDWLPQSPHRSSRSSRGQDLPMQFLMDGMESMDLPEGSQMTIRGSDTLKASRALRPPALVVSSSSTLGDTSLATRPTKYLRTDSTPFEELPTKKPRGRRPVDESELGLDSSTGIHDNASPTEEQIAFAGRTKTGKIKKVFLCQVPGCGRCFRRSEHLRRHIRSLHSNEKPYDCAECGKAFSRSDNLVQHRRGVHGLNI